MTKRIVCLLTAAMLALTASFALAETYSTSGDGKTTVCFYAESDGNASVRFKQQKGTCPEVRNTLIVVGVVDEAQEWGKYHVEIESPNGTCSRREWNSTTDNGSFSISLPDRGTYLIRVIPYTAKEMTASWTLDTFVSWTAQPRWWVDSQKSCTISASQPSSGASLGQALGGGGSSSFGGGGFMGGGSREEESRRNGTGNTNTGSINRGGSSGQRIVAQSRLGGITMGGAYDMGAPYIGNRSYGQDEMNMDIYWVQVQMKATGRWYQGESWDCTGRLGDHTMSEIRSFMSSRGYRSHSGRVDQNVIDELSAYLGGSVQPVYVGGIYNAMNSIMYGGSAGGMNVIWSNLIDMVPHVTAGARWVQVCLFTLGYYTSSIEGMYGEGTDRAVKAFQRAYGWEQRNYVTLGVARAMLEAYCQAGCNPNALP